MIRIGQMKYRHEHENFASDRDDLLVRCQNVRDDVAKQHNHRRRQQCAHNADALRRVRRERRTLMILTTEQIANACRRSHTYMYF